MRDLSKLEQAIYHRELRKVSAQIADAYKLIQEALRPYHNKTVHSGYGTSSTSFSTDRESGDAKELNEWLSKVAGNGYYSGSTVYVSGASLDRAPEFLRQAILDVAIKNFCAQVDSVEEISNAVQHLEHQVKS